MLTQLHRLHLYWRLHGNFSCLQHIPASLHHDFHSSSNSNTRSSKYRGINPVSSRINTKQSLNIDDIGHEPEYLTQVDHLKQWSDIEEAEALEDLISQPDHHFMKEIIQHEEQKRKAFIRKIIEQKYFKKPQEVNLLTWSAKEQIRYLNKEYPDEWTIDRLAEAFPTNREGIIKILQSSYVPKTSKELMKHDTRVMKHWLALKDGIQTGKALKGGYEVLRLHGKLDALPNAAGACNLPVPEKPLISNMESDSVSLSRKEPGLFESIVRDYCEKKTMKEKGQPIPTTLVANDHIEDMKEQQQLLLSGTVEELQKQGLVQVDDIKTDRKTKKKRSLRHSLSNQMASSSNDLEVGEQTEHSTQTLNLLKQKAAIQNSSTLFLEENRMGQRHVDGTKLDIQSHRRNPYDQSSFSGHVYEKEKGNSVDKYMSDASVWNESRTTADVTVPLKESKELKGRRQSIVNSVVYDSPKGAHTDVQEGYIFDEKTGYQHPFGQYDPTLEKIKVPKDMKGKTIRRGKAFYDDDGEMLYKVP